MKKILFYLCCLFIFGFAPVLDPLSSVEHVVDSYPVSNYDTAYDIYSGGQVGRGQSITADGSDLTKVSFYLTKTGSPTGNAVAKLYAHSGSFGTSSIPTGAALATSANLDVSTLTGSMALYTLIFGTPYTSSNGTNYVVTIEYSGGDVSNYISVGHDTSSSTHGGNRCYTSDGSSWTPNTGDVIFYQYGN